MDKAATNPIVQPSPDLAMDFTDAIRAVIDGKRVTRLAWGDPMLVVFRCDGYLKHRKADGSLDALIVSDGDLDADDWVIVREQ